MLGITLNLPPVVEHYLVTTPLPVILSHALLAVGWFPIFAVIIWGLTHVWVDMKEVLPLLARPEYYERLKSGRARGGEAVIMVENIRNYFDALSRFEAIYTPPSLGEFTPPKKPKQPKRKLSASRS